MSASSSTPASVSLAAQLQSTLAIYPPGSNTWATVDLEHHDQQQQQPPAEEEVIWKFPDNLQSAAYTKEGKGILKRAACSGAANLKYEGGPEDVRAAAQRGIAITGTPVMCHFARMADIPMMAELLRTGGNLEYMGERGDTPLLTACLNVFSSAKMKVGPVAPHR